MNQKDIERELRSMLLEMQKGGDVSPQLDFASLPVTASMASAGLDSVARVGLGALIDERLGVWLDDDKVSEDTTVADIVAMIANHKGGR